MKIMVIMPSDAWFNKGEILTALSISKAKNEDVKFLVWSKKQYGECLIGASAFKIIDNSLSARWKFKLSENGFLDLAPEAWQTDDFWEKYHDGDPDTEYIFQKEMAIMLTENINLKKILEIINIALRDWPKIFDSLEDYEADISNFIMGDIIKNNVENVLSKIDFSKYAWEAESLSELLEVYNYFDDGISLKEIIDRMRLIGILDEKK